MKICMYIHIYIYTYTSQIPFHLSLLLLHGKSPMFLVKSNDFDLGSGPARFKEHLDPAGDQGFQEGLNGTEWDAPDHGESPSDGRVKPIKMHGIAGIHS